MKTLGAILWKEFIFFKRKMFNITSAALITPILYMIAFGWGLGRNITIDGGSYMEFVIPGIIALTTMNTSFSAISVRLNAMRMHDRSFEFYLTSPIDTRLIALSFSISGVLRGIYAAFLVYLVSLLFGVRINIDFYFILICILNSFVFATLAYGAAMTINSHYDMNRFTTFIMTPMSFLCGTFFSLESLPGWMEIFIGVLPLSQTSQSLRSIALKGSFNMAAIPILIIYGIVLFIYAVHITNREIY